MKPRTFLASVRNLLEDHYGIRLKSVILYGSAARGDWNEDSDIDLLVLLDGPVALGMETRAIVDIVYRMMQKKEIFRPVHVIPVDVKEYESQSIALYRNARKEGIAA